MLLGVFEFHPAEDLADLNVNRPDTARAFLFSFGDRDAAEDSGLTHLR